MKIIEKILRDYFAAKALQGMLAHSRGNPPHGYKPIDPKQFWHDAICMEAYKIAAVMLKIRKNN